MNRAWSVGDVRGGTKPTVAALVVAACWVVACARPVQIVQAPMGSAVAAPSADPAPSSGTRGAFRPQTGTWTGRGRQSDGRDWPVKVELTAETGRCGTIVYPTVPCRGTWTCSETTAPDGWREAVESIQSGHCIDGGTFRYRLRDDSIEWTWSKADGQNLTAHGVLTRNDEPDDGESAAKGVDWDSDEE